MLILSQPKHSLQLQIQHYALDGREIEAGRAILEIPLTNSLTYRAHHFD